MQRPKSKTLLIQSFWGKVEGALKVLEYPDLLRRDIRALRLQFQERVVLIVIIAKCIAMQRRNQLRYTIVIGIRMEQMVSITLG
jgi:hypothetical protein